MNHCAALSISAHDIQKKKLIEYFDKKEGPFFPT